MRHLLIIATGLLLSVTSFGQAIDHLFLPNVLFSSDASIMSFTNSEEYIRDYSNSEYAIKYANIDYKLGISFMGSPVTLDDMHKSINAEIAANPGIKVYTNEIYKNFLIVQILDGNGAPQDSVRASHILLEGDASNPDEYPLLLAKADSLRLEILKNNNFAEMAMRLGTDGTREYGGDLGWFTKGMMVKPFEDACFNGNVGDIKVVTTQFGVHLIQINGKKFAADLAKEETGNFIELAISVANGEFIVSLNSLLTEKSKLDINRLKKMIDSISILSLAQADNMVGYPMTESAFTAAQGKAYQMQDENLYFALNTIYANQFSFSEYFKLKRNFNTAYYSMNDYLDMIFNEEGTSDLVRLRTLTNVTNNLEEISNSFPEFQEKFYATVGTEIFKDSVYIAYVGVTNFEDRIVAINYYSMITEKPFTEIYKFTPSSNGWVTNHIPLPKNISANDENGPAWDFETGFGDEVMVINAWTDHTYFIKTNNSVAGDWVAINQVPTKSENYVLVELGGDVSEDMQFTSNSFHFPKTTGKGAEVVNKVALEMTANGETFSCDESESMFTTDNVQKLTNGQCCMNYTLAQKLKAGSSNEFRVIRSTLKAENIDADADLEYFVYYISNGKVVGANGVDFINGKAVAIDAKVILKYLKTQKTAANLCLFSLLKY